MAQVRTTSFSPRELEILLLKMEGCSNKEIANKLGIAMTTVKIHNARMLERHHCRNMVQLSVLYVQCRL